MRKIIGQVMIEVRDYYNECSWHLFTHHDVDKRLRGRKFRKGEWTIRFALDTTDCRNPIGADLKYWAGLFTYIVEVVACGEQVKCEACSGTGWK